MKQKKQKKAVTGQRKPGRASHSTIILWAAGIILAVVAIVIAASGTPFFQDDAYISFRFVHNYLAGEGLVFNYGEQVEGYTNFLWVILLTLSAKLGFKLESAARWLGIIFSGGTVIVAVFLARRVLKGFSRRWTLAGSVAVGFWVAVNPAMEYWSVAGLETAMFAFLVTLTLERLLAGSPVCWSVAVLATLTRPEGGLLFVLCYAWYLLRQPQTITARWMKPLLYYVLPLLPFAAFKFMYYGSIFPNPFYAKTGFSPEYWQSGLQYCWLYLQHFGLWGVLPVMIVIGLVRSGWRSPVGLAAGFWLVYTLYVISVGGDVLRAHRFFVPIWPVFSIAAVAGFLMLLRLFKPKTVIFGGACVVLLGVGIYQKLYSAEYFAYSRRLELGIVEKMRTVASLLKQTDNRRFSIAVSTIGRLGYDLPGQTVIDMLGLTDSTVAKHPEKIPGMQTTWRERHFNAGYVLSRDPDYILFSTGYKPSAPAERALVLHSKFRQNYYVALYPAPRLNRNLAVYKRKGDFNKPDSVWPDLQLANDFNDGMNYLIAQKTQDAMDTFNRMLVNGPKDYSMPYNWLALVYMRSQRFSEALAYADSALQINPYSVSALTSQYDILMTIGDTAQAKKVGVRIARICPWLAR